MRYSLSILLLALSLGSTTAQFLKLNLHRHQSCAWKKSAAWERKIEFQGGHEADGAQLRPDDENPGCYSIKGKVKVHEDISEELLIYLSVSTTGDNNKPPEICRDANKETGCGGVGSCLYCRPCESLGSLSKILGAQLIVNGKVAGCEPLKAGSYDDVELRFCLPKLATLLEWQGISEKALDHILAATTQDNNGPPRLSMFVTVYIFDKNVRALLASQRKLEKRIKDVRGLDDDEQLDGQTYWTLPFNQMIKKQSTYVGCHKLYGTVTISDKQQ